MIRALLALLALGFAIPCAGEEAKPASAYFLVAKPHLADPNFEKTVVLMAQQGDGGSMGVIVNRPTDIALSRVLPEATNLADSQEKVFFGGPVARQVLVFVFRAATAPEEDAIEVLDGVYMSSSQALLAKLLARKNPVEGLRVYAGHAGWAPGQLEGEISRGDWDWAKAGAKAIFEGRPEALWPELRRRASETTAQR